MNNLPIYELNLTDDTIGAFCVSLVDEPAINTDFIAFSADEGKQIFSLSSDEQRVVSGIALRPDFLILRKDKQGRKYYVKFSKETIRSIAERFAKNQYGLNISLGHQVPVDGCYVFESYIIDRTRGIDPVEFKDIEDGSWYLSVKIDNPEVWNLVKTTDLLKGFSLELQLDPILQKFEAEHEIRSTFSDFEHIFGGKN